MNKTNTLLTLVICLITSCQTPKPEIITCEIRPITVSPTTDVDMEKLIAPYKKIKDTDMNVVIGYSDQHMQSGLPEALLNNFVANAMLVYANSIKPTDIAITNLGGLRNDLPKGDITIGDIMQIMPFDNAIVFLELTGEDTEKLCHAIAQKGGEVVAGISLKIEKEQKQAKAKNILIQGKPIDKKRTYRLITTDYLSFGNDHLEPLAQHISMETPNQLLRDVLINYIVTETKAGHHIHSSLKHQIYVEN